ncbi:MAG: F0F1 ATP synthase subunit A [Dehalococcoidales bacterium]|nr:F0F1 ATP synthase subunit A [Dehalococcoidales bacterium]
MSKKRILGCSFPVLIGITVVLLLLMLFGIITGPIGQSLAEQFPVLAPVVNSGPDWLHVEKPVPVLAPGVIARVGGFPITNTMITAWITILILVVVSFLAFRKPKIVPSGLQKVMEFIYGALLDFCNSVAGETNGRRFFPFVATIFLFVITNAWLGLLPFYGDALWVIGEEGHHVPLLRAANTDINVPLALAIFAWISIETFGLKANGFLPYMKKFLNFKRLGAGLVNLFKGKIKTAFGDIIFGVIDVFVGILEGVSEIIRLVSFTFRLFGNMTAGEVLILVVAFLAPLILGSVIYGMELFFGFLQALIFGGLTLVWMNMAIEKHGDEQH